MFGFCKQCHKSDTPIKCNSLQNIDSPICEKLADVGCFNHWVGFRVNSLHRHFVSSARVISVDERERERKSTRVARHSSVRPQAYHLIIHFILPVKQDVFLNHYALTATLKTSFTWHDMVRCNRCHKQYIGETKRRLNFFYHGASL